MSVVSPDQIRLTLRPSISRKVRALVESGAATSEQHFVEDAIVRQMSRLRRERLREEFARASSDPQFLQDIDECMNDFRFADAETARMIDED